MFTIVIKPFLYICKCQYRNAQKLYILILSFAAFNMFWEMIPKTY